MRSSALTPQQYLAELPEERLSSITELRKVLLENLPQGFEEVISYGMLAYVVPHSIYPNGYHCDPSQPLPFISIAAQKNFVALYHMGLYANPDLLKWFEEEYPKHSKTKLDMGKSCIRFKKREDIPYDLIAHLAAKISPAQWIETYEKVLKK
ncbi:DUF1801 domain-containing protein [Pedobacter sp. SYSU D00535]|uniref:DUF1801 domain-containing protein n=1 Tax=Pedobacter sp. SYSU D00535 TaxID=2810308 RepID=UPI001A96C204|nr:DUF1801 domain-containing protein [Pedobacter sp. SYSU D00535]